MKQLGLFTSMFLLCLHLIYGQNNNYPKINDSLLGINKSDSLGRQGRWMLFNQSDDIILAEFHYINDTLQGNFAKYSMNGRIVEQGYYKNGLLHGVFFNSNKNGDTYAITEYNEGKKDGVYKLFAEGNRLVNQERYENGVLDTVWKDRFGDKSFAWDRRPQKKKVYDTLNVFTDGNEKRITVKDADSCFTNVYVKGNLRFIVKYDHLWINGELKNFGMVSEIRVFSRRKPYLLKYLMVPKNKWVKIR